MRHQAFRIRRQPRTRSEGTRVGRPLRIPDISAGRLRPRGQGRIATASWQSRDADSPDRLQGRPDLYVCMLDVYHRCGTRFIAITPVLGILAPHLRPHGDDFLRELLVEL